MDLEKAYQNVCTKNKTLIQIKRWKLGKWMRLYKCFKYNLKEYKKQKDEYTIISPKTYPSQGTKIVITEMLKY